MWELVGYEMYMQALVRLVIQAGNERCEGHGLYGYMQARVLGDLQRRLEEEDKAWGAEQRRVHHLVAPYLPMPDVGDAIQAGKDMARGYDPTLPQEAP
jgi:hypothetical protein